jgi:maleate cis-trans isomerase
MFMELKVDTVEHLVRCEETVDSVAELLASWQSLQERCTASMSEEKAQTIRYPGLPHSMVVGQHRQRRTTIADQAAVAVHLISVPVPLLLHV